MQEIVVHPREMLERRLDVNCEQDQGQTLAENCSESCSDLSVGGLMMLSSNGFMIV
jgi:hypothetical protein